MDVTSLWNEYGMEEINQSLAGFFPDMEWNLKELFSQMLSGDVWGALTYFGKQFLVCAGQQTQGLKSMIVWLFILGILSAVFVHFGDIFENHQISELSFADFHIGARIYGNVSDCGTDCGQYRFIYENLYPHLHDLGRRCQRKRYCFRLLSDHDAFTVWNGKRFKVFYPSADQQLHIVGIHERNVGGRQTGHADGMCEKSNLLWY